jgi:crotonobetainyl-CoA:carnitine CoA-transferase CaiB-like acyl-CoA transferase
MSRSSEDDQPQSLAGVRVIEFSHTVMGPTAGLVLADLGADVVKVEPAPEGDHTRRLSGFAAGFFGYFNRNKRSVALDLKTPEGRDLVHRLVAGVDVLVENYGPGTMERLGCGYGQLSALNPRLIYCTLKGFLSGPYEDRPALEMISPSSAGASSSSPGTGGLPRPMRRRTSMAPGTSARAARSSKVRAVRSAATFSATATLTNRATDVPSSAASRRTSRSSDSCRRTASASRATS